MKRGGFACIIAGSMMLFSVALLGARGPGRISARLYELNAELWDAVRAKRAGRVGVLIQKGADPNAVSVEGWTVLMEAASNGDGATFKTLVKKGGSPRAMDHDGFTALMAAATGGNKKI